MAISPDKIIVRKKFQHKIDVLTKRVEHLFEYDASDSVSAITGVLEHSFRPEALGVPTEGLRATARAGGLGSKMLRVFRCKKHKVPCFTTQLYWDKVDCLTKVCDSASEHVAWIKNRPEAYGPSYDIEEYELIESLREVDNYDPFDTDAVRPRPKIRHERMERSSKDLDHTVCDEDGTEESIGIDMQSSDAMERISEGEALNFGPCRICLRMLYNKISNPPSPERFSPTGTYGLSHERMFRSEDLELKGLRPQGLRPDRISPRIFRPSLPGGTFEGFRPYDPDGGHGAAAGAGGGK
jgi:hypothetical protein